MKTKIIGIFCLLIGVLAFIDSVKRGGLNLGIWHIKPFLFPAFCIGLGWLELHGRENLLDKRIHHHSNLLTGLAVIAWVITLWLVLNR